MQEEIAGTLLTAELALSSATALIGAKDYQFAYDQIVMVERDLQNLRHNLESEDAGHEPKSTISGEVVELRKAVLLAARWFHLNWESSDPPTKEDIGGMAAAMKAALQRHL